MLSRNFVAASLMLPLALPVGAAGAGAHVTARWALPGDGGWDYLAVDDVAHLLYVSRGTHVAVIDTTSGKPVGDIGDTPGVHGIAIARDLGRGYITAGKADQVKVFDLVNRQVTATVPVGKKPDAIVYDNLTHRVVALNGHSDSASVIDATSNTVIATLELGGGPEFAHSDGAGHLYVNLEDRNQLAAVDLVKLKVTAHWALPGCDGPTGLALDVAHHRSFSVCANAAMTVLDTDTGRAIATVPIGQRVDGAVFDPATGNAYSANGEGTMTVVHEADPEHFDVVQTLTTAPGARTIALDPAARRLYLPGAALGSVTPGLTDPHPKPSILPNSFFVLVVAPD